MIIIVVIVIKDYQIEIQEEIKDIKSKPHIINNYTTNNTLNEKKIVINCAPGQESISHLTIDQQREIMNKGLNSLMFLIRLTNFNKEIPENQSYCVTALNDKHATIVDTETNSIVKTEKTELFDKVLAGNIKKLEIMSDNKEFLKTERIIYKNKLDELKTVLFKNKKGLKKYYNEINLLSYNNKDLVYQTWAGLKTLDEIIIKKDPIYTRILELKNSTDDSEEETESEDEEKYNDIFKGDHIITYHDSDSDLSHNDIDYDLDSESETESSSNSESEIEYMEVSVKGTKYLVENNKVYIKNDNGTKGEYYGSYKNGKVIKANKDLEI